MVLRAGIELCEGVIQVKPQVELELGYDLVNINIKREWPEYIIDNSKRYSLSKGVESVYISCSVYGCEIYIF